jgi:NADH dehydrogenase (ubiquinone) Fe-S protein 3
MILKAFNKLNSMIPSILLQQLNRDFILIVSNFNLLLSLNILKKHLGLQYKILSCISGVDFINNIYRFSIIYELLSITFNSRIRIKIFLQDCEYISSISKIFINANWWEREIWDLFGIVFENHFDLRRILNDYSFEGFPMRKDFPLSGFVETKYYKNAVNQFKIQFSQELRSTLYF